MYSTPAATETNPSQLPAAAVRQEGMSATARRNPPNRGSTNWSTHITTVTLGTAMADQPATLKKPFSICGNHHVNNARRALGKPYRPLAEYLKLRLGTSRRYIEQFEQLAAQYALARGYDGVICGHIHRASLQRIHGTLYGICGDWVESCSALIESERGELQLLRWPNEQGAALPDAPALLPDAA